jgi:DeoR family transcriptional regulator of aga operon
VSRQSRLDSLLELVVERGDISVDAAAEVLKVSVATIRRDLDTLAERQLVNRTHGGATATAGSFRLPISYKIAKGDEVKKQIAAKAASLVSRYQVVGINGGTTTTEVARALAASPEFAPGEPGEQPALTVVTNALNIATELTVRHQIKIVVTGGVARPQSYELTGPYAEAVLNEVMIDIAFLGIEAFDAQSGAGARHEDEARVNRQIAARAKKVIIVSDSSKFQKSSFAVISPVDEIDMIITDSGLDSRIRKGLERAGVEVVIT